MNNVTLIQIIVNKFEYKKNRKALIKSIFLGISLMVSPHGLEPWTL